MDLNVCNAVEKSGSEAESKLIDIFKEYGLDFKITECCNNNRFCIDLNGDNADFDRPCCCSDIIVQTSNKDVLRICQRDILYIAIENRKSAVYVDGRRIETNYSLDYWKNNLNPKIFAQPHSSFLVNLCYVQEITKNFVIIKHKGKDYSVYTSSRKLKNFKKAFLEYSK